MNNEFVSKALESARALQQTVAVAAAKGAEQAKPLVADAMARAQSTLGPLAENARLAVHHAAKAVSAATEPKPPPGAPPAE